MSETNDLKNETTKKTDYEKNKKSLNLKTRNRTKKLAITSLFSALIAVGAFIKVPIPYIPFTAQTLFVIMAGLFLGPLWGSVSVAIYLALGLSGVPIFSNGGGIMYVFQPSFGYLLGFLVAVFVVGLISKNMEPKVWKYFLAGILGLAIIYTFGVTYMYCILHYYIKSTISLGKAVLIGYVVFIPSDLMWCFLASYLTKRLKKTVKLSI